MSPMANLTRFWTILNPSPNPNVCSLSYGGECITDGVGQYGNGQSCTFRANQDFALDVREFSTETNYDFIDVYAPPAPPGQFPCSPGTTTATYPGCRRYSGYSLSNGPPSGTLMHAGDFIRWHTDGSVTSGGFEMCVSAASFGAEGCICRDNCVGTLNRPLISDGICDDGGDGAEFAFCALGSDCVDCGTRCTPPRPPALPPQPSPTPPSRPRPPSTPPVPRLPGSLCFDDCFDGREGGAYCPSYPCPGTGSTALHASDGVCDDGGPGSEYAYCNFGRDCSDCGIRYSAEARGSVMVLTVGTCSSPITTYSECTAAALTLGLPSIYGGTPYAYQYWSGTGPHPTYCFYNQGQLYFLPPRPPPPPPFFSVPPSPPVNPGARDCSVEMNCVCRTTPPPAPPAPPQCSATCTSGGVVRSCASYRYTSCALVLAPPISCAVCDGCCMRAPPSPPPPPSLPPLPPPPPWFQRNSNGCGNACAGSTCSAFAPFYDCNALRTTLGCNNCGSCCRLPPSPPSPPQPRPPPHPNVHQPWYTVHAAQHGPCALNITSLQGCLDAAVVIGLLAAGSTPYVTYASYYPPYCSVYRAGGTPYVSFHTLIATDDLPLHVQALTTAPFPHRYVYFNTYPGATEACSATWGCICQEIYPPQSPPSNPLPLPPSAPPLACQAPCGAGTCALYQGVNCSVLRSPPLSCSCGDCCVQPRFDSYACDVPCAGATCGAFSSKLTCAASASLGCSCNGVGLGYPNPGCCAHELTAVLDPTNNDRDAANSATNTALIQSVAAAAAAATSAAAAATAALNAANSPSSEGGLSSLVAPLWALSLVIGAVVLAAGVALVRICWLKGIGLGALRRPSRARPSPTLNEFPSYTAPLANKLVVRSDAIRESDRL